MDFEIERVVADAAPELEVLIVEAEVINGTTSDELWMEICDASERIRCDYPMEAVNKRPAIAATRRAYKALGKEPNRYRPSSEALCRRCIKGLELYRTLTIIDLINLLSIETGHSIGGFDRERLKGNVLRLGRGCEGEPYEAIGRGQLNIDGLPVIRDAVGGIGTPTSDNDRTKLSETTSMLLMTINMYGTAEVDKAAVVQRTIELLEKYANARNISIKSYHA